MLQPVLAGATRKVAWRIVPFLCLLYMFNILDRANVGFARIGMTKELGLTDAIIDWGYGLFYVGYLVFEVPSNLLLRKFGARVWISRIMITWGVMAGLTAAVTTPWQFYTVRFLLGLAEAGFFPGVVVYLTHWFPSRDRARALATFMVATPFAQIISPKISNWLLEIGHGDHPPVLGMVGWQWVYVFWAVPAVVLGFFVYFWLVDRPKQAKWLTAEEGEALESELERERAETRKGKRMTVLQALKHPKVLLLALVYFCTVTGKIFSGKARPVSLFVTLFFAPNSAKH